ncbi:MAG: hypothetical protein Q9181_003293 [Wetmoreana brouardii]
MTNGNGPLPNGRTLASEPKSSSQPSSIAIIGMACRTPGKSIDPQQRILLECAYEAIENASLALDCLAGKDVGVFAAQSNSDYAAQLSRDPETLPMFKATGCAEALMSNRISYAFDLRGPSLTVDTACSSSLTAIHLASQSLRAGEASMAIAGGCHINLTPDDFISFSMSK